MVLPGGNRVWLIATIGVLCFVIAALLPTFLAFIKYITVNKLMVLNPNSQLYASWVDPPIKMYQKYYFFNVINKDNILEGEKPEVVQIGPYTYRQHMPKKNIVWNNNHTVTFVEPQTYIFDRSLSVGDEHDTFTSINIPLVTLAYMIRDKTGLMQSVLEKIVSATKEELFINLTVSELIWGYPEPLFKVLQPFMDKKLGGKFGLLMGRNNSNVGALTVFTGEDDKSKLNVINVWAGKKKLNYWDSEEANMINGTDGSMYHPFARKDEIKYMFTPDMCRSMPYVFESEVLYRDVTLWHFPLAKYAYANGTEFPPNQGFCKPKCLPSGLQDIGTCRSGAPMQLSNPHFYDGDPMLAKAIGGLKPNRELHENYMDVEPLMGIPWRFAERLQINIFAEKSDYIKQMGDIESVYFPVLWFEQKVEVTDEIVSIYNKGFVLPKAICDVLRYVFIGVGIILCAIAALELASKQRKTKVLRKEPSIQNKDEDLEGKPLLA
ncbi:scavenger receptor class B member 1-like [Glandiceps talaboti]